MINDKLSIVNYQLSIANCLYFHSIPYFHQGFGDITFLWRESGCNLTQAVSY